MTLAELNNSIGSREDFVAFVKAMSKDLRENPSTWENTNLESFLEALGSWVEDMDGYYINQGKPVPTQPDWKVAADMLMAARTYE